MKLVAVHDSLDIERQSVNCTTDTTYTVHIYRENHDNAYNASGTNVELANRRRKKTTEPNNPYSLGQVITLPGRYI